MWRVGVESLSGVLEWNLGVECWSGILVWSVELESWEILACLFGVLF